jgi:hypothetical protein
MNDSTNAKKEKFKFFSFFFTHLIQECKDTGIENWVALEPDTDYEQVNDVAVFSTLEQLYTNNTLPKPLN